MHKVVQHAGRGNYEDTSIKHFTQNIERKFHERMFRLLMR